MKRDALGLPAGAFAKLDAEDDELFYEPARLVCHIDDGAIAALTQFYREILPAGGILFDLMSSWVSHLPPDIARQRPRKSASPSGKSPRRRRPGSTGNACDREAPPRRRFERARGRAPAEPRRVTRRSALPANASRGRAGSP